MRLRLAHRLLATASLLLLTTAAAPADTIAGPKPLAGYFKLGSGASLTHVEIYHIDSRTVTRTALGFEALLSMQRVDAYVRLNRHDDDAVKGLYAALNETFTLKDTCAGIDMRWAVVFNYADHTREAVGFGAFYSCVALLSGERFTVTPSLYNYLFRTFPFMR